MNILKKEILLAIISSGYENQRRLAEICNCSLGAVNGAVKELVAEGFLDNGMRLTRKTRMLIEKSAPKRAIILAAGQGIQMPPNNTICAKPLLKVKDEALIDRLIRQLKEVDVNEIYVIVGFDKERFEYLIDKYNVSLVVNTQYQNKSNLHSLSLVKENLQNCYIVPCDIWCESNPFSRVELYSWYLVSQKMHRQSSIKINRKRELAVVPSEVDGNEMIGISYLTGEESLIVKEKLVTMDSDRRYEGSFWEETLYDKEKMIVYPKIAKVNDVTEINSFEDLQRIDDYSLLPISEVAQSLNVTNEDIKEITLMKKGTTNYSYSFMCKGIKYIMRIRTDTVNEMINHQYEADVYRTLSGRNVSDEVVYINPRTGLKISKYINDVRFSNPQNKQDISRCMKKLRQFHDMRLSVGYEFDLFEWINYLESLRGLNSSVYSDYEETKKNVSSLKRYIDSQKKDKCITHMDSVEDNFLISQKDSDWESIRIIDWEYAAMQDPHLDIAMYGLYSFYDKEQFDYLISQYFDEKCDEKTKLKIYCYISVAGLLWSNWCEYKLKDGTQFGEYSLKQYRYAKEYYRIVKKELKEKENIDV